VVLNSVIARWNQNEKPHAFVLFSFVDYFDNLLERALLLSLVIHQSRS